MPAQIFIGRVLRLHARDELIDAQAWRVRLQNYFPVGRFGASFYVTTRDRFSMEKEAGVVTATTAVDEM